MAVSVQNGLYQRGADALSLMFGEHQNVLHKYNGVTVANDTDKPHELPAFVCGQNQQRVLKPVSQSLFAVRIGCPADN